MIFDPDDMKDAPCADSCEAPKADASQPEGFKFDQSAMIMAMLPLVGATLEKVAKSKQVSTLSALPAVMEAITRILTAGEKSGLSREQLSVLADINVELAYQWLRATKAEVDGRVGESEEQSAED